MFTMNVGCIGFRNVKNMEDGKLCLVVEDR